MSEPEPMKLSPAVDRPVSTIVPWVASAFGLIAFGSLLTFCLLAMSTGPGKHRSSAPVSTATPVFDTVGDGMAITGTGVGTMLTSGVPKYTGATTLANPSGAYDYGSPVPAGHFEIVGDRPVHAWSIKSCPLLIQLGDMHICVPYWSFEP